MKPKPTIQNAQSDLFRSKFDQILDLNHPLIQLANKIDWPYLEQECAQFYSNLGRCGSNTRLLVGLHLLKVIKNLSDEGVCATWVENPYFQYFCGEQYFQHRLPIDRPTMTKWRKRIGDKFLDKLIQESLRIAYETKALKKNHVKRIVVDTTVQPKAIQFPTDANLRYTAICKLVEQSKKHGIKLRQTYLRVCKTALIKSGRYRHAKQLKRAKKAERFIQVRLGRVIRDIRRTIKGNADLKRLLQKHLQKAETLYNQTRFSKHKLYSWHAPEVECIGKGKAAKPYEFGCKVSISTNVNPGAGGYFILDAHALHGNPHDSKTLQGSVDGVEQNTGIEVERIYVDKGYQGHDYEHKLRVYKSGQRRIKSDTIKKELKRRTVIEPIIGHVKSDHRMEKNYLSGLDGDEMNAKLCSAGYNFKQLLNWLSKKINSKIIKRYVRYLKSKGHPQYWGWPFFVQNAWLEN